MRIRCEEKGAHWTEEGGQDQQERGTQRANARPCRQQGHGRKGLGPERWTWGWRGGRRPRGLGRRAPQVVGGAGRLARRAETETPPGRRPEGLRMALKFGAGALDPKKANVGRVVHGVRGDRGE